MKLDAEQLTAYLEREGSKLADFEHWRLALDEGGAVSASTTKRIRRLERELARKEKALAEAAALLILKKNVDPLYREDEDDDTTGENEKSSSPCISEAQASGARLAPACRMLGISARTIERWRATRRSAIAGADRIDGQAMPCRQPRSRRLCRC